MYGLEGIKAHNSTATNRVMEVPKVGYHVEMEFAMSMDAAKQNYELGLITYEQYVEELAELRNIYC